MSQESNDNEETLLENMTMEEAENNLLSTVDDDYFDWLPLPKWFLEKHKDKHEKLQAMYEQKLEEEKRIKVIQEHHERFELKKKIHEQIKELGDKRKKTTC